MSLDLASASAFCARAVASWVLRSPSCCADSVVLLGPTRRLDLARKRFDLGLGVGDLASQILDLVLQPGAGAARLILFGFLLTLQISVGDGVGDARGKFGIFREEIDDDDPRLLDGEHRKPVVIGFQHALFWASWPADS